MVLQERLFNVGHVPSIRFGPQLAEFLHARRTVDQSAIDGVIPDGKPWGSEFAISRFIPALSMSPSPSKSVLPFDSKRVALVAEIEPQ